MAIPVEIEIEEAELLAQHHIQAAAAALRQSQLFPIASRSDADRIGDAMQELSKARGFLVEALKATVEAQGE